MKNYASPLSRVTREAYSFLSYCQLIFSFGRRVKIIIVQKVFKNTSTFDEELKSP